MEEIALVRTNPSVFVEVQIWFMISVRLLDTGSGKESREKPLIQDSSRHNLSLATILAQVITPA